ncbi:MAG: hypothetical protein GY807_06430, partial [Gammaproteobacteria bacterium]|nr:hypothetical protein [Gammaproteobacteria bacterium]
MSEDENQLPNKRQGSINEKSPEEIVDQILKDNKDQISEWSQKEISDLKERLIIKIDEELRFLGPLLKAHNIKYTKLIEYGASITGAKLSHFYFGGHSKSDLTARYEYQRAEDILMISYEMPYLSLVDQGGPVEGMDVWWNEPFTWEFPELSVKIANNTESTLLITEAVIEVSSSEIDMNPIIFIEETLFDVGYFKITNYGWGPAKNVTISFDVTHMGFFSMIDPLNDVTSSKIKLNSIEEDTMLNVESYVPDPLRNNHMVLVYGIINYSTKGFADKKLGFKVAVALTEPPPGAPRPPSATYDIFLEAGKAGYKVHRALAQEIKPGD